MRTGTRATLVLLPGLDGTDEFFAPLLAALPPWLEPRIVTYPGSGRQDYETLLGVVRAAIADVGACHVLGWSFSGPLALALAAAEPERVRGVILVATFVRSPHRMLSALRHAITGPAVWSWRFGRRLPLWLFRPRADPLRQAKSRTWRRVSASVIAARLRAVVSVDATDALRRCPQPVLYLASARDGIVPNRNAGEIVALRPAVQVAVIPGAHQAMYSHPLHAADAIATFVAAAGVTGTSVEGAARP